MNKRLVVADLSQLVLSWYGLAVHCGFRIALSQIKSAVQFGHNNNSLINTVVNRLSLCLPFAFPLLLCVITFCIFLHFFSPFFCRPVWIRWIPNGPSPKFFCTPKCHVMDTALAIPSICSTNTNLVVDSTNPFPSHSINRSRTLSQPSDYPTPRTLIPAA